MDALKLARMANQIGAFFESEPDHTLAVEGVASHLRRFWEPRMRTQLLTWIDETGGPTLTPLVLEAVNTNRERLGARTPQEPGPGAAVSEVSGAPRTRPVAVRRFPEGDGADRVAVEEPLEIRVEGLPTAVTMRTPGDDFDLVLGFLATEGVIDGIDDVRAIAEVGENTVDVRLAEGVPTARARSADRQLYANSSCGICGIASIDRLIKQGRALPRWEPAVEMLGALPDRLRSLQPGFESTGGLHAAALFDADGALTSLREDVGRHNAVDKVLGARLRADDLSFARQGLLVSSRAGFEIVQKALVLGVPVVATVGAPTSLAVDAAVKAGLVLYGWVRGDRCTRYA